MLIILIYYETINISLPSNPFALGLAELRSLHGGEAKIKWNGKYSIKDSSDMERISFNRIISVLLFSWLDFETAMASSATSLVTYTSISMFNSNSANKAVCTNFVFNFNKILLFYSALSIAKTQKFYT